jgi:hypothetical protein
LDSAVWLTDSRWQEIVALGVSESLVELRRLAQFASKAMQNLNGCSGKKGA